MIITYNKYMKGCGVMNINKTFKKEKLEIPNYNNLNFVDFINALYGKFSNKFNKNNNIKLIDNLIPNNKHILFILLDGTGSNLINSLGEDSILKKYKKLDLLTVSPSTTGCALTSLATAKYPSEHGIIGWFSYNRQFNRDYYPVLFKDRKSDKSLTEFGINSEDIYKEKSVLNSLGIDTKVVFPNFIYDSIYSKFVIEDNNRISYESIKEAFNIIKNRVNTNNSSFTYLYIPDIDSLSHSNGVYSHLVKDKLCEIENCLQKLITVKDLTVIISADHGQIDIIKDIVMDFDKYNNYFYALPGIDFSTATYYVKKECEKKFISEFNKDFKNKMFLFRTEEFTKNNIFGPTEASLYLKDNLGEYISVCKKGYYLINSLKTEDYLGKIKGCHSGFSKEELYIPLIIIDSNNL